MRREVEQPGTQGYVKEWKLHRLAGRILWEAGVQGHGWLALEPLPGTPAQPGISQQVGAHNTGSSALGLGGLCLLDPQAGAQLCVLLSSAPAHPHGTALLHSHGTAPLPRHSCLPTCPPWPEHRTAPARATGGCFPALFLPQKSSTSPQALCRLGSSVHHWHLASSLQLQACHRGDTWSRELPQTTWSCVSPQDAGSHELPQNTWSWVSPQGPYGDAWSHVHVHWVSPQLPRRADTSAPGAAVLLHPIPRGLSPEKGPRQGTCCCPPRPRSLAAP